MLNNTLSELNKYAVSTLTMPGTSRAASTLEPRAYSPAATTLGRAAFCRQLNDLQIESPFSSAPWPAFVIDLPFGAGDGEPAVEDRPQHERDVSQEALGLLRRGIEDVRAGRVRRFDPAELGPDDDQ